jgi:hypothetical protein
VKSKAQFEKRRKEIARQEKQKEKRARRLEAKERQAAGGPGAGEEDPDLAGIVPGPQPPPEDTETE